MTDLDAAFEKLRELEAEAVGREPASRPAAEARAIVTAALLTPSGWVPPSNENGHDRAFTRDGGKIEFEAEPRASWRLRRRMIRCNKATCTTCPHGPYLYVRITVPGGAVSDVSLGREPAARHVFDKLGDRLDGEQISAIVQEIREGGR